MCDRRDDFREVLADNVMSLLCDCARPRLLSRLAVRDVLAGPGIADELDLLPLDAFSTERPAGKYDSAGRVCPGGPASVLEAEDDEGLCSSCGV